MLRLSVHLLDALLHGMDPMMPTTQAAAAIFAAAAPKQDDLADSFMLAYAFSGKALAGEAKLNAPRTGCKKRKLLPGSS